MKRRFGKVQRGVWRALLVHNELTTADLLRWCYPRRTMQVAGLIAKIIREDSPSKVCIDVGGLGVGVYDRLAEQGYSVVTAVNFGGKPIEPTAFDEAGRPAGGPANRRAELWMRKALEGGRVRLPDRDSLQADLVSCGYKYESAGRLVLESKQEMRKRGVPSLDEADAVALCFAEPLIPVTEPRPRDYSPSYRRLSSWMAA
jgi:hypothetical protein